MPTTMEWKVVDDDGFGYVHEAVRARMRDCGDKFGISMERSTRPMGNSRWECLKGETTPCDHQKVFSN